MKNRFWKGKRVLITGFEGFLGSHLTKRLVYAGAYLVGLDKRVGRKTTILEKSDYQKIKCFQGDVSNKKLFDQLISHHKINTVFHLAAEAIVGRFIKRPAQSFQTNIQGTWNILESCRKSKDVKVIVVASSDKAYGTHKILPYKEHYALQGLHPYDVSKSCADLIAQTYAHSFDIPVAISRCGNIFGPGDLNFSRLLPDMARSIAKNKKLLIRSDGKFVRDYIYVEDVVEGYLLIAEKLRPLKLFGEAFNFSNEQPLNVLEMVNIFYAMAKKKPNYQILAKARYEINKQYLSAKKAKRVLGWAPRYSLEEGLAKTWEWYDAYFKG